MTHHRLVGPRSKIKWANKRIDDLKAAIQAFGQDGHRILRSEYDAELKRLSVVFSNCSPIPPDVSILIGEVLQHQRSALDFLIWQLIEHAGAQPSNKSCFPIFITPQGYRARGKAVINGVSSTAETLIRANQPFQKGPAATRDPLWMLHDLNNIDKHRALIVAGAAMLSGPKELYLSPPVDLKAWAKQYWAVRVPVEDGRVLAWFETEQREVKAHGRVTITIVFNEVGPAEDEPVTALLTQLSTQISAILDSFEVCFN
ncbi:hypothetical protein HU675_0034720 [Bradyrhizobium septentrionale]|uniref:hypothetical protein n=1 Tax=Bradyrhizobium septentrionale TaxID=1404411 RepID=UPI00159713D4|nr:hypothetical protein [Bradyrhizobium septentrionale]UGY23073.1 hypothetical protein HU675_0034720 [Bradyrhizobium septentrionale]